MSDDLFGGVSSSDTGRGGVLLPEGFYPELRLVKAEVFRQFFGNKPRTFTCDVEILEGPHAGKVGSGPFEQLEGNQFPSYDVQGRARVMVLLGALFGYKTPAEIDANINGQTLALVTSDLQPNTGCVFSARVTHKTTSKGKTIQVFSEIAPVFGADGKVKVVRGKGQQAPTVHTAAGTAFVAPPAPAALPQVAAPAAPAAPAIPPGWAVHPSDQRWIFNTANPTEMRQLA